MRKIYLSETAHPKLQNWLKEKGYSLKILRPCGITYEPVDTHPDIYMCSLGPSRPVFFGDPSRLGSQYPDNICYNAACTGQFFIHNLKHTDPELLKAAKNTVKINVSQGYTKCNTLIIDEKSIITSDRGIYKSCYGKLDVLLITPGHIRLKNFDYGFIGGASGRIDDTIVFNGDLSRHPDCEIITKFIEDRGLHIKYFNEYTLEDIGSIIL